MDTPEAGCRQNPIRLALDSRRFLISRESVINSNKPIMKKIIRVLLALLPVITAPLAMAEEKPAISIREAVEIAEKAKGARENGDRVFIASITLERSSLLGGKTLWIARWSGNLPANNPHDHEIGVQIAMDGSVKHIVKGPAEK